MPHICTVLLDRDGTVIEDRHYLHTPAGVCLLPHVGEALAIQQARGAGLFLVSNQSGIGRGMFLEKDVLACNQRLTALLHPFSVSFVDSVFCPHAPEEPCPCRKPAPGMWHTLQKRHGLEAASSIMVGDKTADMGFAAAAGLAGRVLVATGKGAGTIEKYGLQEQFANRVFVKQPARPELPNYIIADFSELETAVRLIEGQ